MNSLKTFLCLFSCLIMGVSVPAQADDLAPFAGEKGTIKIAGGTAHIPVMKEAAKKIMMFNPEIQITVAGGGSGAGIKLVGEGLVDIGNSGRRAKDKEIASYGLKMFEWAIDGVAIIVNPENSIRELSQVQLMDIYSGEITNWHELGGQDKRINLYTRDASSGTRAVFWKKALQKGDISHAAHFVVSNGAMKSAVSQDPYGIGYVSVGHIDATISPVTFNGIAPTLEKVKNGEYKISRGLYSNTKGEPDRLVKKFIEYLFSAAGKQIVSQKGFIPVQ